MAKLRFVPKDCVGASVRINVRMGRLKLKYDKKTNRSAVYEPVLMVDLFWDQVLPFHDQGVQWIIDLTLGWIK